MSAGSGIANALGQAKERRRQRRELERMDRENILWHDRVRNEAGSQRKDAVYALNRMREAGVARMNNARGAQAVGGTSGASLMAEKQASANAMGDTVARVNAAQQQRADRADERYRAQAERIASARNAASNQRAQLMAQAAGSAAQLGAGLISAATDKGSGAKATATPVTQSAPAVANTNTSLPAGGNVKSVNYNALGGSEWDENYPIHRYADEFVG